MRVDALVDWAIGHPAVTIGTIFLLVVVGKRILTKIIKNEPFKLEHFYAGVDLLWTTVTGATVNTFDNIRYSTLPSDQQIGAILFIFGATFLLLIVSAVHQDWEFREGVTWPKFWRLGIVTNAIGLMAILIYVIQIRGVK